MDKSKVFIVDQQYKANYNVCFVDVPYKEKNASLIKGGRLVNQESEANIKVYIVELESQANIKIMRENFPG